MKTQHTQNRLGIRPKICIALLWAALIGLLNPLDSRADDLIVTNDFGLSQTGDLYVITNGTVNVPKFDSSLGTLDRVAVVVQFPTFYWKTVVAPTGTCSGSTGYSEWQRGVLEITNSVLGGPWTLEDQCGYTNINPAFYVNDGESRYTAFGSGVLVSGEWISYYPNDAPYYDPHVLVDTDDSGTLANVTGNGNLSFDFGTVFDAGLRIGGGPTPGERYLLDSGGHFIGTIRVITTYSYTPACP